LSQRPVKRPSASGRATVSEAYDLLAPFYDDLCGGFERVVMPMLAEHVLQGLPPGGEIVDLGCGTGGLAKRLSESGFRVTAVDCSRRMLELARVKAPDASVVHSRLETCRLARRFHAAVCAYDTLNNLNSLTALTRVFKAVRNCLLPNGYFLFDVNADLGFRVRWSGGFSLQRNDATVDVTRGYSRKRRRAVYAIAIDTRDTAGAPPLLTTIVETRFTIRELHHVLRSTGFRRAKILLPPTSVPDNVGRVFFLAQARQQPCRTSRI
jgi:SAM-dependent methyltransferase